MSSGLKTRGSLIHIAAGRLGPDFRLLGQGPRWGESTLRGRKHVTWQKGSKSGAAPLRRGSRECKPASPEGSECEPRQQSWTRRFEDMQVLGEKREVMERGIDRERVYQQMSEPCRPGALAHSAHHCRGWGPSLPAPIRRQGLPES